MIFKWFKNKGSSADAARDAAVPRHIGELWLAIQETAEREDSSWSDRNVISYYHEGAEAQKDILRWLAIYQRSFDPHHLENRTFRPGLKVRNGPEETSGLQPALSRFNRKNKLHGFAGRRIAVDG